MKKLLAKIRNKKLKGNVSLLVIFVLLASSVISLLSINQIQRLLTYGNMTFNYFRAFYLAKAGTELGLTEVYNRWDGFNHEILSGSAIITWNFLSGYEWFEPHFNMTISWSFATLTNDIRNSDCSWNKIRLTSWAWIMLSLFKDITTWTNILSESHSYENIQPNSISSLQLNDYGNDSNANLTFAFFTYSGDSMKDIVVSTWRCYDLHHFIDPTPHPAIYTLVNSDSKKYLTIKNSWTEDVEFCITMGNEPIPYSNSLITVFWHYGDMEVWLQSIVKKWVPDWTLNVLDEPK